MVLQTKRLILRRLTRDDAEFMLELLNEPAFLKNVADRGVRDVAGAALYLEEKILPSYQKFGFGFYRVDLKETAEPIGICGLAKRDTLEEVDVGFSILERYWRHGYALEAAEATMAYGRETLGLPHIIGITARGNEASIQLLGRLGLKFQRRVQVPGFSTESLLFG